MTWLLGAGFGAVLAAVAIYLLGRQQGALNRGDRRELRVPLDADEATEALVLLPHYLRVAEWDQFVKVLNAMKDGLVTTPGPEPPLEIHTDQVNTTSDTIAAEGWQPGPKRPRARFARRGR